MANSDTVYANYPPAISPEEEEYLVQSVKDWSIQHGLAVRPPSSFVSKGADPHTVLATNAPVTLFPSPFPKSCFDHASSIQCTYNELYAAIANNEEWLDGMVKEYEPCPMCKYITYLLPMHSFTPYLLHSVTWLII
jgi:hypothetical protein